MTGACHAPVNGRQGKALADTDPTASPVPIEKSADLEMDGREDFVPLPNRKRRRGFRRSRIPSRRAQCSFDGSAVKRAFARIIERFLDTLAEENRVIFMRRYWFSDSYADISNLTGLTKQNSLSIKDSSASCMEDTQEYWCWGKQGCPSRLLYFGTICLTVWKLYTDERLRFLRKKEPIILG